MKQNKYVAIPNVKKIIPGVKLPIKKKILDQENVYKIKNQNMVT